MAAGALTETIPTTADEARFSLPYLLGRTVLDGTIGFDSFEPDAYRDPAVRPLAERVHLTVDDSRDPSSLRTTLKLVTTDGRTFRRENRSPPGSPENPMDSAALAEKFRRCRRRLTESGRSSAVDADAYRLLDALSDCDSIRSLVDRL
jgi:2-methylcitrate dehydratase PrpD